MNIPHRRVYVHVSHHLFHRADRCAAIYRPRAESVTARTVKIDIGYSSITQRLPPSSLNRRDRFPCLRILEQVARWTSVLTQALQYGLEVRVYRDATRLPRPSLGE